MASTLAPWVQTLLEDNNTSKYYIEYQEYLSNHVSHLIIALGYLGATRERCEEYLEHYHKRLEKPGDFPEQHEAHEPVQDLLGKNTSYYVLLKHYQDLLSNKYGGNLEGMLRGEIGALGGGMIGAALHGLIQTGYGFAAKNKTVITEGMAYMHHAHVKLELNQHKDDLHKKFGRGRDSLVAILDAFRMDPVFDEIFEKHAEEELFRVTRSRFQRAVAILSRFAADLCMGYVYRMAAPPCFNPDKKDMVQVRDLMKTLIDGTITLYVKSNRKNDFFLLHAVTSSWALLQLLYVITDYDTALRLVANQLCNLLIVYFAQRKPALEQEPACTLVVDESFWKNIKTEAIGRIQDEHNLKLIQVAYERWRENPDLGTIYSSAARVVLDEPFVFL